MCALLSWGATQRVQRIILSENSNTQFDFSRIVRHLEAAGQADARIEPARDVWSKDPA
jgi:hypothetical protein